MPESRREGHPVGRAPRRVAHRVGLAAAAAVLAVTVLANAALPGVGMPAWLQLPLEASGMGGFDSPAPQAVSGDDAAIKLPQQHIMQVAHVREEITVLGPAKRESSAFSPEGETDEAPVKAKAHTPVLAERAADLDEAQRAAAEEPSSPPVIASSEPQADDDVVSPDAGDEVVAGTAAGEGTTATSDADEAPAASAEEPAESAPSSEPEVTTPSPKPETTSREPEPEETTPEADETPPSPEPEETTPEADETTPSPEPEETTPEADETTPSPEPEETTPEPDKTTSPPTTPPATTPPPTTAPPTTAPPTTAPPTTAPPTTAPPTTAPPTDSSEIATVRTTLHRMLNELRASQGLPPLTYSSHLQSVAQNWANQLRTYPDGASVWGAHNPNYSSQVDWYRSSELIIRNTGGANMSLSALLSYMHSWWAGSPDHRPWMLDPEYTHVGYGFVWSNENTPYAVAVLGVPQQGQ